MKSTNASKNILSRQMTLRRSVMVRGIGLHSGCKVEMKLRPAPADSGIRFERTDLPGRPVVTAVPAHVCSARLCTVLCVDRARVSTVEHLLSALYGLGVDNARVELNAEELPILDGSALPFVRLVQEAGSCVLDERRTFLRAKKTVAVRDEDRYVQIVPARRLSVDCSLDFGHPLISAQRHRFVARNGTFEREIAPARTFGFLKDVDALHKAGLARGGSLSNAVVIDKFSILNPGGLRFGDEFTRHKVIDILGDLALLGSPLVGEVRAHKSGHELHHRLIHKLLNTPGCFERIQLGSDGEAVELPLEATLPVPGLQSA